MKAFFPRLTAHELKLLHHKTRMALFDTKDPASAKRLREDLTQIEAEQAHRPSYRSDVLIFLGGVALAVVLFAGVL